MADNPFKINTVDKYAIFCYTYHSKENMNTRLNELIIKFRKNMDPEGLEISNLLMELRGLRAGNRYPPAILVMEDGTKLVIQ